MAGHEEHTGGADADGSPEAPRHALPEHDAPLRDEAARGRPRRFKDSRTFPASVGWTVAGGLVPGLGLLRARHRVFGGVLLGVAVLVGVSVAVLALVAPQVALSLVVQPGFLTVAWVALATFGVLWVISIAVTHLTLRPVAPTAWQRLLGAAVVGVLSLAVGASTFSGARVIYDTSSLVNDVFTNGEDPAAPAGEPFGNAVDPWANKPRLNVLVLGGDAGSDRIGNRTDTVILASIDTRTGNVVLFSLPRQTQRMPFPPGSPLAQRWPRGYTDGVLNNQEYALNAIYDNVPAQAPQLVPNAPDKGAAVLKMTVGEALGLPVDYYAMVNMDGFVEFVNALGGITVNVNRPVPVGGQTDKNIPPDRWLPPGPNQHFNGSDALWYARGRYGIARSDYDRMSRQRCVVQAVVKQANPTKIAANYEALSKAGQKIVNSDVPTRQLPGLLTLALRVKDGQMTSVSFENGKDGFETATPDWNLVRTRVQAAISAPAPAAPTPAPSTPAPSAAPTSATPTPTRTPSPTATRTTGRATPTPSVAPPSSVVDECAYNPVPVDAED